MKVSATRARLLAIHKQYLQDCIVALVGCTEKNAVACSFKRPCRHTYVHTYIRICIRSSKPCLNLSQTARSRPDDSLPMSSYSDLCRSVLSRLTVTPCRPARVLYSPVNTSGIHTLLYTSQLKWREPVGLCISCCRTRLS